MDLLELEGELELLRHLHEQLRQRQAFGETRGREVALWVEDEGPGLPPEAGDRLFERFMRAAGEEPRESGMGLGLFIVKSIVERHGGRVEARDRGGAAGTRVCVILPAGGDR